MTEDDIRRIVREELERAKETPEDDLRNKYAGYWPNSPDPHYPIVAWPPGWPWLPMPASPYRYTVTPTF